MNLVFVGQNAELNLLTTKMVRLQSIAVFTVLANFIVFGREFIELWAGDTYIDSYIPSVIVLIAMSMSLLLDFTYLTQMAKNDLKFRVVSLFACLIISYVIVIPTMGYSLLSFAVFMATSILSGQVVAMIVYIKKKTDYSLRKIFFNILKMMLIPAVMVVVTMVSRSFLFTQHTNHSIIIFLIAIVIFNIILLSLYWILAFNKDEKGLVKRFIK